MRKLGIALLVLVVIIVVAALVIPSFLNVNRYRPRIQAELQQRLSRPVTLGDMHLSLLPPSFRVDNVAIGEDARFGGGTFAQAQQLYVSAKLLPLLRKDVQISSLELKRPRIELIHNREGAWNFSSLGQNTQAQPAEAQKQPQPEAQPQQQAQQENKQQQQQFSLASLKITDGQLVLTDQQKGINQAVYDHIDATVNDYAPGKPLTADVTAHLPGRGKEVLELKAKVGPLNDQAPMQTPLDGTLRMAEVSLSGIQKFLNSQALAGTDAIVSGSMSLKNESGKISSSGNLKLDQPRVRGLDVGYPITADYKITNDLSKNMLNIEQGTLKLGPTPLSVTGAVDMARTPVQLNVKVTAKDASIQEAARLASAFGVAFSPGAKIGGKVNADIHAEGPANAPAMNGMLAARDLVVSGQDIPQQVSVKAIDLQLTPQQIRSNDFTATAGNTKVDGRFTLAQYTSPNPSVDAALRTANAQIGELLGMAKAYGVQAVDGMTGSGQLSLDVQARGPVKNPNAMTFSGSGNLVNASLKPPSMTQPLNLKNAALKFTQNSVSVQNLAASLGQTNATGNATVRNFAAPQVQFALNADKINVAELQQITAPAPQANPQGTANQQQSQQPARQQAQAAPPQPAPAQPSLLTKATGQGTLSAGAIIYDQLVLNNVRSNVTLDHGIIKLAPLTAEVYGGQETGAITLNARNSPMTVDMAMKLNQVDANKLLSSVTSLKDTLYGLLSANGQTSFAATSANDIARTLNGKLSLNLNNGKLAKIDMLNQLASVGKFVGFNGTGKNFTDLVKLTGDFNVRNGVAQTDNLRAVIDGGTLAASGLVNLVNRSLDMAMTAVLSSDFSKKVGGTNIGGFMSTALANNRGELVIPVRVTGSFDAPQFAPDVQKVAQMKMQNLLPSSANPGQLTQGILGNVLGQGNNAGAAPQGGLGGIVGAVTGQQQGQQQQGNQGVAAPQQQGQQPQGQAQRQQQPSNPVQDALGGLLGGKKKQQQQQQPPPK